MGEMTYWFSYKTCIAAQREGFPAMVRENEWGPTTGKHLNWIDDGDKSARLSGDDFQKALAQSCPSN